MEDPQFKMVSDSMHEGEDQRAKFATRLKVVEDKLDANTAITEKVSKDAATILALFDTLEAGFKVLASIGKLAKFLAPILTVAAFVWAIMHGKPPPMGE